MKKVTAFVMKVAELKGLYVTQCEDTFRLDQNYLVGENGTDERNRYFRTLEEVEIYLGIREYEGSMKFSFEQIKKR